MSIAKLTYLIGLSIGTAAVSNADVITVSLDSLVLTGSPNSLVTFTGTLQNNSGAEVFLNGADANLGYSELTGDFTSFFAAAPLSLPDGTSYSGSLLSVGISSIAIPGDYFGSFDIQGGIDGNASDIIGSADIQISVSTVPEALPPGWLLGIALLVLAAARSRRATFS